MYRCDATSSQSIEGHHLVNEPEAEAMERCCPELALTSHSHPVNPFLTYRHTAKVKTWPLVIYLSTSIYSLHSFIHSSSLVTPIQWIPSWHTVILQRSKHHSFTHPRWPLPSSESLPDTPSYCKGQNMAISHLFIYKYVFAPLIHSLILAGHSHPVHPFLTHPHTAKVKTWPLVIYSSTSMYSLIHSFTHPRWSIPFSESLPDTPSYCKGQNMAISHLFIYKTCIIIIIIITVLI